jgi:hypothetical protein
MRQSNLRMIWLNLGLGFKSRGLDASFYHDPDEPAVLMESSLTALYKVAQTNCLALSR